MPEDARPEYSGKSAEALSIVIPAYNEEDNIEGVVRESVAALAVLTDQWDIVVVDDASTDATPQKLEALRRELPQLQVVRNAHNIGCHPSTLVGFPLAQGDYRYFIPSDRQIPAAEISKFVTSAKAGHDVVYSWRVKRADPPHRRWISGTYNLLLRLFFGIRLHDVDSSSLLTRRAVEQVLPTIRSDSAFITVEILLAAQRQGLGIGEVVINHRPRTAGVARGINLKDLSHVPLNFLRMLAWFWQQKLQSNKPSG